MTLPLGTPGFTCSWPLFPCPASLSLWLIPSLPTLFPRGHRAQSSVLSSVFLLYHRDSSPLQRPLLGVLEASLVAQMVKNLPAMQETRVQSLRQEDPLEKRMETHSSILAWRIPWREEPGGLESTGSQRVTGLSDSYFHIFKHGGLLKYPRP